MINVIDTNSVDIKRITKEHWKQICVQRFDCLDEKYIILERHKPPKIIQGETDNLNWFATTVKKKKKDSIINSFQVRMYLAQMVWLVNAIQFQSEC